MGILDGKVGVVTGAASGIGRAIAQSAAAEGARVVVADILDESGEKTVEWIREHGGEARYVHCDVTSEADVEAMVAAAVSSYGGLDWAANNAAGGEVTKHLHQLDDGEWNAFVDVALRGVFLCMKHELPALLERGGGSIVNTGSMVGVNGMPLMSAYAAAKGGVIALTKSAAAEYAPMNVRVNVVNPGMILTPGNERFLASGTAIAEAALSAHALGRRRSARGDRGRDLLPRIGPRELHHR